MAAFGLVILFILAILVISLPRQKVFIPFILCVCYLTIGVTINFAGFNLYSYRILAIAGIIRVIARGELNVLKLTKIDIVFTIWAAVSVITYTILFGSFKAFFFKFANSLDAICLYYCFRCVITDFDDLERIFKYISIAIIPLSLFFLYESRTMHNLFSAFGGVEFISEVRDGKMRCEGPFRHPILAGMFGVTVFPFIIWQWWKQQRPTALIFISIAASLIIVFTATSSGALLSLLAEIFALFVWFFRDKLNLVRWSAVLGLFLLSMIMKAPIWYIIARVSNFSGGGGFHRAYLLDVAFKNIGRWWLVGTTYTADWFPYVLTVDPNNSDITNQFLVQGISGGLITMGIFIAIIVYCFQSIGKSLKLLECAPFRNQFLIWTLGVTLFGHVVAFISVSYFDQIRVMWYLLLAAISSITYFVELNPQNNCSTPEGSV